jgi:hypothetical protein
MTGQVNDHIGVPPNLAHTGLPRTLQVPKCKQTRLPDADHVDPEFDIDYCTQKRRGRRSGYNTRTVLLRCTTPSAVGMQTGRSVRKR